MVNSYGSFLVEPILNSLRTVMSEHSESDLGSSRSVRNDRGETRRPVESSLLLEPCAYDPTSTSLRTPARDTCLWANVQSGSQSTPTVAALQEQNNQVLQQLRESVSRVRELARNLSSAEHDRGRRGVLGEVHFNGTPVRGVSLQSGNVHLNRGDFVTPAGHVDASDTSRRIGAGALFDTSVMADGRSVKVCIH